MGLIINEVRKLNKDNIMIVSNNTGGLKEQITSTYDGILINTNNLTKAKDLILKYFTDTDIKRMSINGYNTLTQKYDFSKTVKEFIEEIIRR